MTNHTILQSPFFVEGVLPFVLLFTVIFAILQKTEVLGKGKRQIDAITAMVIALIVISFANAVNIINNLLPFLAISVVVILIFMILIGFFFHGDEFKIEGRVRTWGIILVVIAVTIAVLVTTGSWDYMVNLFFNSDDGSIFANVVFLVIVGVAVAVVMNSTKQKSS